jgi:hypothetical protein
LRNTGPPTARSGTRRETRHRLGLKRGGHDDEDQVRPDRLLHFAQHGDRQVRVQAALVKLIEDDAADASRNGSASSWRERMPSVKTRSRVWFEMSF